MRNKTKELSIIGWVLLTLWLITFAVTNYYSVESINTRITEEKIAINNELQIEFNNLIEKNKEILNKDIELENLKQDKKDISKTIKVFQEELIKLNWKQEFNAESFEYSDNEDEVYSEDIISDVELDAIKKWINNN